jgi:hypothetical protein
MALPEQTPSEQITKTALAGSSTASTVACVRMRVW